jgi:hypothetical protein
VLIRPLARDVHGAALVVPLLVACSGRHGPPPRGEDADPPGTVVVDPGGNVVADPPPFEPVPGFRPPVAEPAAISSTFGPRWKWSQSRYEFHLGIDYYAARGAPLFAIGPGRVYGTFPEGSATYPNGGNVVVIEHAIPTRSFHGQRVAKIYALYLHTDTMLVSTGDAVVAGQKVATMGMTGDTDFVHLHFETRVATPCSLSYQLAHPGSSCVTGFDPHVHPFLFVGGANMDQIAVEQVPGDELVVLYSATRGDLDLDVVETDLGTIGFGARDGLDASSSARLDDFDYGFMRLVPRDFRSDTDRLEIELHFPRAPAYLEVRDVYGKGLHYGVSD